MVSRHAVRARAIIDAVERLTGERPKQLSVRARALPGGLEAQAVVAIDAEYQAGDRRRRAAFVVKHLEGHTLRERAVYEQIVARGLQAPAPRLLAVDEPEQTRCALLLEAITARPWPWRETRLAQLALEQLAAFHQSSRGQINVPALVAWDYEAALEASALTTLEAVDRCRHDRHLSALAQPFRAVQRMVLGLRQHRLELGRFAPFGRSVVHGDVHPGNVLIRSGQSGEEAVFIDWGRARPGSPLEDVSSWLQSLGYWEPEARRRHDTIFRAYLSAWGMQRALTRDLRAAYWLAGASNALAGALTYHLARAGFAAEVEERRAAAHAAFAWLRVLRRADSFWS